jgi:hypothetical protein
VRRAMIWVPVVGFLLACSGIVERSVEEVAELGGAEGVDVNMEDGKFKMSAGNGIHFELGEGSTLPANWPADVPVYPGATVTTGFAWPANDEGGAMVGGSLHTADAKDAVLAFYAERFAAWPEHADSDATRAWQAPGGRVVRLEIEDQGGDGVDLVLTVETVDAGTPTPDAPVAPSPATPGDAPAPPADAPPSPEAQPR